MGGAWTGAPTSQPPQPSSAPAQSRKTPAWSSLPPSLLLSPIRSWGLGERSCRQAVPLRCIGSKVELDPSPAPISVKRHELEQGAARLSAPCSFILRQDRKCSSGSEEKEALGSSQPGVQAPCSTQKRAREPSHYVCFYSITDVS